MALKKANVTVPTLPKEAVDIAALGGEVVVRGLKLSERLALWGSAREGEARYAQIADLLAVAVEDAEGKPLLTADEWDALGGTHMEQVLAVFDVARRLSGLDIEVAEKN